MDPKGKVALITGGASGIGFEITKELLKSGVKGVLIADINLTVGQESVKKLAAEFKKEQIHFQQTNVAIETEYENAIKKAIQIFGQLDIIINNAGILSDKTYMEQMKINLGGISNGVWYGLKYLRKDQGGNGGIIVNTSSISVFKNAHVTPMYASTKAGVLNLSQGWGHPFHYNYSGVRVVAMCPGATSTPLIENMQLVDELGDHAKKMSKLVIWQQPDVVGRVALYLIKNAESGSVWIINEGNLYKTEIPKWESISKLVKENI